MDSKTYGLSRLTLGPRVLVGVDRSQYVAICEARSALFECLLLEDGFDLVVEDYLELETTLLQSAVRDVLDEPPFAMRAHADVNLFNRQFAHLLTVGKMYRDQAPARLKRLFPEDRGKLRETADRFDALRDSRLGYAVTEILRDHVQHAGFPIDALNYESARVLPLELGKFKTNVIPYVGVRRPLEDRRLKEARHEGTRRRLEGLGCDQLDLRDLIRDYVEGLASVHASLRADLRLRIERWEAVLSDARSRYQSADPEHGKLPGLYAVALDSERTILDSTALPEEPETNRRRLERKNRNFNNLRATFVTSEATV